MATPEQSNQFEALITLENDSNFLEWLDHVDWDYPDVVESIMKDLGEADFRIRWCSESESESDYQKPPDRTV